MSFLPENYEAPKGSNMYLNKFPEGETKFRILSRPIVGWLDWKDNKPLRYRMDNKPANPVNAEKPIKHFWAMICWDYQEQKIKILDITQATIRKGIENLCNDSDWGAPYFYDIKVIRKGEGVNAKYSINPVPEKPITETMLKAFRERPINLEALYDGADPFSEIWDNYTPGIFSRDNLPEKKSVIIHKSLEKTQFKNQEVA